MAKTSKRRAAIAKKLAKVQKYGHVAERTFSSGEAKAKFLGKQVKTPTPCSCWMCGNQRKYFGSVTEQELKSGILLKEGLKEFYTPGW